MKDTFAAFCESQFPFRISLATERSSASEISFLKYFSDANFSSRFFPILGKPITDVFIAFFLLVSLCEV